MLTLDKTSINTFVHMGCNNKHKMKVSWSCFKTNCTQCYFVSDQIVYRYVLLHDVETKEALVPMYSGDAAFQHENMRNKFTTAT